ncbi:MAG TPA: hypothetical protein VGO69_06565 [Pyrinomonadaceae bacterium]|jgi:hypothetical protein|nr:hypothetical protein [Pyrinomonadaceae bacterium]
MRRTLALLPMDEPRIKLNQPSGIESKLLAFHFPEEFRLLSLIKMGGAEELPENLLLISAWTSLIGTQQSKGAYRGHISCLSPSWSFV